MYKAKLVQFKVAENRNYRNVIWRVNEIVLFFYMSPLPWAQLWRSKGFYNLHHPWKRYSLVITSSHKCGYDQMAAMLME